MQLQIDEIAKQNLDLIRLSDALMPVKEKLSQMLQDRMVGHLDYLKSTLDVKSDFIEALKRDVKLIGKKDESPTERKKSNAKQTRFS